MSVVKHLLAAGGVILLAACTRRSPEPEHHWVKLVEAQPFTLSFDTTNIERLRDSSYLVFFENRRKTVEQSKEGRWNRLVMRGALRCDPLGFKTPHVEMRLDSGATIASSGTADRDSIVARPWRTPPAGGMDEAMMREACRFLTR